MQPRLYLHVGFHKTGSSALQKALYDRRLALREHKLFYPQPILPGTAHVELSRSLGFVNPWPLDLQGLEPEEIVERYAGVIRDAPDDFSVILSCEEFCLGNYYPRAMSRLQEFLARSGRHVTVIAYVRDPLDFLLSIYLKEVRDTASTRTFSEFLEVQKFDLRNICFSARLDCFREIVGAENVMVRDYDALKASKTDIASDFLLACGVSPLPGTMRSERVNANPHPTLLEAIFLIRKAGLPPAKTRALEAELLKISAELPRIDAAEFFLGARRRDLLQARIEEVLRMPQPLRARIEAFPVPTAKGKEPR